MSYPSISLPRDWAICDLPPDYSTTWLSYLWPTSWLLHHLTELLWATSWLLYHLTELLWATSLDYSTTWLSYCELPLDYSTTWLSYPIVHNYNNIFLKDWSASSHCSLCKISWTLLKSNNRSKESQKKSKKQNVTRSLLKTPSPHPIRLCSCCFCSKAEETNLSLSI